jgi:hypothetical protein
VKGTRITLTKWRFPEAKRPSALKQRELLGMCCTISKRRGTDCRRFCDRVHYARIARFLHFLSCKARLCAISPNPIAIESRRTHVRYPYSDVDRRLQFARYSSRSRFRYRTLLPNFRYAGPVP